MEALLNYQTIICDLTGMELSNASLLDESTSAAEAMTMLFSCRTREQKKENINKFFVSDDTFLQTISLLQTRAEPLGIEVVIGKINEFKFSNEFYGCFIQYPGIHGNIIDLEKHGIKAKSNNIKIVVAADLLSLCILKKPSEFDADVVVGCETMAMVVALHVGKRVISCIPPRGGICKLPHSGIEHLQNLVEKRI